jgi:predicted phosphodiesterase
MQTSPAVDVARAYARRFPHAGNLTVAKRMAREEPRLFRDVEAARSKIRLVRGAFGKARREDTAHKELFQPLRPQGEAFDATPPALVHFANWGAVPVAGPARVLILADVHLPYHDRQAVILALKHGRARGADTVLLLGDLVDHYAVPSKWQPDPRKRDFPAEVALTRKFLEALRGGFPRARIIWKEGNHEERFENYMKVRAPDLLGVDVFSMESVYQLDRVGVEFIRDKRPVALGKLTAIHGHEYRFAISNPVGPARGLFLKAGAPALCAHFHVSSQYSKRNVEGRVVSTFSSGCLCGLAPDYAPLNDWNHGLSIVHVSADGAFAVENPRIIDGKVWS